MGRLHYLRGRIALGRQLAIRPVPDRGASILEQPGQGNPVICGKFQNRSRRAVGCRAAAKILAGGEDGKD
jgi:hypothetical protein